MRQYKPIIAIYQNDRGIWDLDTSKGCTSGLNANKNGCYSDCYAAKFAKIYGYDFSKTILRFFKSIKHERQIVKKINSIKSSFIRIGNLGDPSENWDHTFSILEKISKINKEIVIITRHWNVMTDYQLLELKKYKVCINTSASALDEPEQLDKSISQYNRIKPFCKSFLRIISCDFNKENPIGFKMSLIQEQLFKNELTIDTVFRPSKNNPFLVDGIINAKTGNFLGKKSLMSKYNKKTYVGKCESCTEQCGIFKDQLRTKPYFIQSSLFKK